MCRNTKPFNGNYHALPGTADSLREALLTCFILANKRQRQTKADAQELNCQRSQQAVAYSTFGPFTSPPTPPRNPQHFPGLDIYLKVSLSFMKHLPLPLYFLPCVISFPQIFHHISWQTVKCLAAVFVFYPTSQASQLPAFLSLWHAASES